VWGEQLTQTNADGQAITTTYDSLGRVKTRTVPGNESQSGGITTWVYDTTFKGAVHSVTRELNGVENYQKLYAYDGFGRSKTETSVIKGNVFNEHFDYNDDGQLSHRYFPISGTDTIGSNGVAPQDNPLRFGVKYEYINGFLSTIYSVDDDNGQCIEHWRADNYDSLGRVDLETLGLAVKSRRQFFPGQNTLGRIDSVVQGFNPQTVQSP